MLVTNYLDIHYLYIRLQMAKNGLFTIFMNPNSDLKNNENVMAANAESSTIMAATAESSTVDAGYAESRISEYAARFAAYSDERLKQTVDHERKVRGWGSERSYFLAALRGECEKRGIDYC